jgi:TRAP-type C4-dicarboxylate transport system permease small subunit
LEPIDSKITRYLDKTITYGIIVAHAILLLVVLGQVVTRLLYISVPWTEEVAMFILCYLVFLGATIGVKNRDHFSMEVITNILPSRLSKYLAIMNQIILVILLTILLWSGVLFSIAGLRAIFPVTLISKTWLYIILPFSAAIMLYFAIGNLVKDMKKKV